MTRRPTTLRLRLVAFALALVLLPTLLSGGAMLVYTVHVVQARVTERNEVLARALAGEVRNLLEAQRAATQEVALIAALSRPFGSAGVRQALSLQVGTDPNLLQVLLLDDEGHVTEALPDAPGAVGRDLSYERYLRDALSSGEPTWTITDALGAGRRVAALVVPDGERIVVSYLDMSSLQEIVQPARLGGERTAAIIDRDGSFVVADDPRLAEQRQVLELPMVRAGIGGEASSQTYRLQGREWLGSVWPVPDSGWAVLVSEPLAQVTAGVRRLQLWLLLGVGVFAVLAAMVTVLLTHRIVRPVERLSQGIRRVEQGAYHQALLPAEAVTGYREVNELARAFEAMAAAVRSREEALARSERSYRTLVDSSLVGVCRSTVAGTVVFCNDAMARILGARAPDELLGDSAIETYRDPDVRRRILEQIEKTGKVTNVEAQTRGADGVERTLLLNVTREGDLLTTVAVDISELKQAAADRERLERQLLHAQKLEAVGRMAGGIAHDFNNLLTAIVGFAAMLKEDLGDEDPRCEAVTGILQSANRAAHLTRSLLAYSRKQAMQPRPVDLCEVVRTVDRLLRRIIGEDVELVLDLPETGLPVMADPGHLEQVLVNLCTNARDAMPGGGRLRIVGAAVVVDAEEARKRQMPGPGRYVQVRVEDSGRGMSPEVMTQVFEPFFTTKAPGSGTGLGLAIVYGIVRQHGGHVEMESELGLGTSVTLLFPRHDGALKDEAVVQVREAPRGEETILLAEDEALVRESVRAALQRAGYQVIEAADGEEAISAFQTHGERIALCLLDVVMPRKNGREAAEAIRAMRPEVPILLASGYTADVLEQRGHGGVGLEVIAKPFTPGELLGKVREKLDRGR